MKMPRLSIAKLMGLVVVVAVDLVAWRALFPYIEHLGFVLALSGIALQVGLLGLIQGRGRNRMFWAGFLASGTLALMTYVWEESVPNNRTMIGSPWLTYMVAVDRYLPALSLRSSPRGWSATQVATNTVVLFLPQLLIALAGGLLFRGTARQRGIAPNLVRLPSPKT